MSRNPFIQDLVEQGYEIDVVENYLVVYGLPYLKSDGSLGHGDLATPIDPTPDGVIDMPSDHQAWFRGERPHDQNGRQLRLGGGPNQVTIREDFVTDHSFSFKLMEAGQTRDYSSFEEKIQTYLDAIVPPALDRYPGATSLQGVASKAAQNASPLRIPDMLSARYHINDLSSRLRDKKIAIIGLGGTGSYILDFIARTHLSEIALFDDDKLHIHTFFRFPGFVKPVTGKKVDVLAGVYSGWHAAITAIPERVTADNVDQLAAFDFVFVSVDHGPSRVFIIDWLTSHDIPFVDCGMGLNRAVGGLSGFVRITGVDRESYTQTVGTTHLPSGEPREGEYRRQGQIAEMNALNAAFAVIRMKQHFGVYERLDEAISYIFDSALTEIELLKKA